MAPTGACAVAQKGGMKMCKIEKCDRQELWGGYCLPHLKEEVAAKAGVPVEDMDMTMETAVEEPRAVEIDATVVLTTDDTKKKETRKK